MPHLFLIFFVLSLAEIALLIEVGSIIGAIPTILSVVFTAMLGSYLVRRQGLATLATIQQKTQAGQVPGNELAQGFLIIFAAALLITPGFVTDTLGFICLTPGLRSIIAQGLLKRFGGQFIAMGPQAGTHAHTHASDPFAQFNQQTKARPHDDSVIEGDFIEEECSDEAKKPLN